MADSESGDTPDRQVDQYHTGRDSWFTEGSERPAEPERAGPERTIHEPARETPVYEETDEERGRQADAQARRHNRLAERNEIIERRAKE